MTSAGTAGAEGVRWDLTPFAPSEQAMKDGLEAAAAAADFFSERWPAETIIAIDSAALAEVLRELAEIRAASREAQGWVFMLTMTDAENPVVRDLEAWIDARRPRFERALKHFELAWVEIPDDRAERLAAAAEVAHERHFLLSLRRFRPFLLSAEEERVLAAREATANAGWRSFYFRTLSALSAIFDDGAGERACALAELESISGFHPDRDVRRRAAETVEHLLAPVLATLAQCYDSLVTDALAVDALRGYAEPMEARNLENELESARVETLLTACEAHHDLAHRWFAVKARLLGLEQLDTIDLFAPVLDAPVVPWDEGRRLAVDVFANLSPTLAVHAEDFFRERRIDAEPRIGKRFGGLCVWPSTRSTGFLYLNWTGSLLDLVMLTHELGHGAHFALVAAAQSDNSFRPGLPIAEIPSTFAHLRLVHDQLAADTELSRPLLAKVLDSAMLYVFVRNALTRYEQEAFRLRAHGEALTSERLSDICDIELAKLWGDTMTDVHGVRRTMWAPTPHMVHARFYLYAYAFAFLVAARLLARSEEPGFISQYERFLAAGGSASPEELLAIIGVDLNDATIFDDGFAVIDSWIEQLAIEAASAPLISS
jgi:oligoendopeptidase F